MENVDISDRPPRKMNINSIEHVQTATEFKKKCPESNNCFQLMRPQGRQSHVLRKNNGRRQSNHLDNRQTTETQTNLLLR